MKTYRKIIFFTLINFFLINIVKAEDLKQQKDTFIQNVLISYENDSVYNKDKYYTNGLQILFTTRENIDKDENKFLSTIFGIKNIDSHNFSFGLGQKIYTANDIELLNPPFNDRPYAGYLYGFLNKNIRFDNNKIDTFGISAGLTGPSSLAENVQKSIHRMIGSPIPEGWDTQLDNEFLFMLSWMRTIELNKPQKNEYDWNIISRFTTNIGTPFTNFSPSIEFRYGWNLDEDLISNRIQTTSLGIRKVNGNFIGNSFYLFLELAPNIVLYDTFLDGNINGNKPDIKKQWFRFDVMLGATLRIDNFYIKFSNNFLSKEFKEQNSTQLIALITVGYLF